MNEPPAGPGRSSDHDLRGDRDQLGGVPQNHEELDGRLRRAFSDARPPGAPETLRASLESLSATVDRQRVADRWSTARGLASAAVAVIAVALVGAVVASQLPGPAASAPPIRSPGPTATSSAETPAATGPFGSMLAVIPWVDATPPPQPARPTPRPVPPGTRVCTPADLTATADWQGATGSMAGGIGVTNDSSTACVLDGPPKLVVIKAGTTTMPTAYSAAGARPGGIDPPGPGLLEPGDHGSWWLFWENWCGQDLVPTSVTVTLPDGSGTVVAVPGSSTPGPGMGGTPRCDAPGSPSSLTATAFEYQPPEPPLVELQPASTTITAPPTATIGQDVTFTVALTNLGDKPAVFDPCPTYSEDLIVADLRLKPPADHEYALNCSAIENALAPGATIVLQMRYPIPSTVPPGSAELLWSMDPGGPFDTGAFGRVPIDIVSTEQVGLLTVTHPAAWRVVAGPESVPNRPVPLFYLSDVPLTVRPCPAPDPKTGAFQGCPEPVAALPAGGVLVTFSPNFGSLLETNPPLITVGAPDASCLAVGADAQVYSATAGTVVTACLRGPDLAANEAEVRVVISSLKRAP